MEQKRQLLGMTKDQLAALCAELGLPRFTASQIARWLYVSRVDNIQAMTNLSLKVRQQLSDVAEVGRMAPVDCSHSVDGTIKYLFMLGDVSDGSSLNMVESVFIPDGDRATLCISCQRGCRMGCSFCVTGKQGFHGHLSAGQILNQILSIPEFDRLTNVVYMGMGEPMDNYEEVLRSTEILTAEWGLAWSPRRITVSTVGVIPNLKRFLDESKCHVAVSLHNPVGRERHEMMPMEGPYPIEQVVDLLKQYDWSGQRRISFEYTMFKGINDDLGHASQLVHLLKGLRCRVNLIRYHASPEVPYRTSNHDTIQHFEDYLNNHGVTCTLRASRGEDIMAACGLLAGRRSKKD